MPIRCPQNLYNGINAHLHSHFQKFGGWEGFHSSHITHLGEAISQLLPAGYIVDTEQSLQMREIDPGFSERIRNPGPDAAIYHMGDSKPSATSAEPIHSAGVLPLLDTVDLLEDLYYPALMIYVTEDNLALGRPVTRLELLSPTNKQGEGFYEYNKKRLSTLKSGLRLVEIHYLHETHSPVKNLPSYVYKQPGAHPYSIMISDPRPTFEEGTARPYLFDVDEPIPSINIPLDGADQIQLDLNAVHHRTFHSINAYSYRVDYERLPENFLTYSQEDQERIQIVMTKAAQVHNS